MTSPRTLMAAWQLNPKKQLGQNFLADPTTAEMIATRAALKPDDTVLEIGAGLGALTIPAARKAAQVLAVDTDGRLLKLLQSELAAARVANVTLIHRDILRLDILELAASADVPLVVLGNLPYNISSQVVVRLIHARAGIARAVLMFQKELARRLTAVPGGKNYGRLTVMLGYCARVRRVAEVGARLFFPRPKVDSEVLEFDFSGGCPWPARDEHMLFRVVKAAFGQRRKTLKNALAGGGLVRDPEALLRILDQSGIDPRRRAETLTVQEFVALSDCFVEAIKR